MSDWDRLLNALTDEALRCTLTTGAQAKLVVFSLIKRAEQEGWILAPAEATEAMAEAATRRPPDNSPLSASALAAWQNVWRSMIAARPPFSDKAAGDQ